MHHSLNADEGRSVGRTDQVRSCRSKRALATVPDAAAISCMCMKVEALVFNENQDGIVEEVVQGYFSEVANNPRQALLGSDLRDRQGWCALFDAILPANASEIEQKVKLDRHLCSGEESRQVRFCFRLSLAELAVV